MGSLIEIATDHCRRTGHRRYRWSAGRDFDFARRLYGREPEDGDPYVGLLQCETCETEVLDR